MRTTATSRIYSTAALLVLLAVPDVGATPLFDDDGVLEVTLTGPLGSVFERLDERREYPFELGAGSVVHELRVRVRGNSRLQVCSFPPLRLNFRRADMQRGIFAGQDKLKLVTHCRNDERSEQNMLEEYAAYRIFNVLTDSSYRVRLLRIRYRDTDGTLPDDPATRFGFVLEPSEQLAERTGTERASIAGFPVRRHDRDQAALIYVFQYLIANTDWGFVTADGDDACCHNTDLFLRGSTVLPVPYDFDLSGLVNAPYAFPDPGLRMKRVTRRRYRGLCTDRDVLERALRAVRARKADILALVARLPGLSARNAARAERFLDEFFRRANNETRLIRQFESRCLD